VVSAAAQNVVWMGNPSVGLQWEPSSTNVGNVLNGLYSFALGRDNAVVIAIRFGLDDPGFGPDCGRHFPHQYLPTRYTPNLYNGYHVLFRDKAAGSWRYHPPQSSTGVEERV
jgi:hypothetical protein